MSAIILVCHHEVQDGAPSKKMLISIWTSRMLPQQRQGSRCRLGEASDYEIDDVPLILYKASRPREVSYGLAIEDILEVWVSVLTHHTNTLTH